MSDYKDFVLSKSSAISSGGFKPRFLPDYLFGFQRLLAEWAVRMGRAAVFADCGLGKSVIELVWAENVHRKTNKPVLLLTPLAVSWQMVEEAKKFGIEVARSSDGEIKSGIVITNYQRLHYFDRHDFVGVVADESSILKNFDGKTKRAVTEFMREMPYRLLATATAAPNDFFELGTSSEALGYLGYQDMLTRFFREDIQKDHLGWGRKTYRFSGHAEEPFWKWVCSWARICRRPSDLGFEDGKFVLPPLVEEERLVETNSLPREGLLKLPATSLQEQRQERRDSIRERCEAVAEQVAGHEGASVCWCHLNDEADLLESLIEGSEQVSGSMSDDLKEERLLAFQRGEIPVLVTKPKIGCFGLNWQHCHNVTTFVSHSFEQYYQSVRRCWRFGQENPVKVSIFTTEGEGRVLANLRRKAKQADRMFEKLTTHANAALKLAAWQDFEEEEEVPQWL